MYMPKGRSMISGDYKIAKQRGQKGYFGRVALDAQPTESGVQVDFDAACASCWQSGVRFGIDYFFDHIPIVGGVRIHVVCVEGHEVDTNNALIALAAANALFQAFGIAESKKKPQLDEENGLVVFQCKN